MITYKELKNTLAGALFAMGTNSDGETIIIEYEPETKEVEHHYKITAFQENGWMRINNYYSDGTVEEIYSR